MVLSIEFVNKLIVQAGLTIGLKGFLARYAVFVLVTLGTCLFFTKSFIGTALAAPVVMLALLFFWLKRRKSKKLDLFGAQLPEAIDLITRGLKAGHPVPVALTMVAREMPDSIGTEFGMVIDEVTYGSDLVTGLIHLFDRVGHPDLPLLISSVSIQSTTGGNLREILENLSGVIRDRQKMQRKIKAISAEGRMSAIFLSSLPIALLCVLMLLMPAYYSGIWDKPEALYMFGGLAFWLIAGNVLIMKLVSFKF